MADQSSQSIVIDAPAAEVMAVIADFPAYPQWVTAAKKVEVLDAGGEGGRAQRVRFVLDAGMVKDDYVLEYDWDGDRKVSWHLVEGQMQKSQEGSYTLDERDGSTEVTYRITIDTHLPLLGMFKRKAERVILDTALKELKKRVEG